MHLKVGSCPNDDNSVHLFCSIFYVVFKYILFAESVVAKKTPQDFAENLHFLFVYFLCVGIPILNKVLSHAHMCVTSDTIL